MIRPRVSISTAWRELQRIKGAPRAVTKRSIVTAESRGRSRPDTSDRRDGKCSVVVPCSTTTSATMVRHLLRRSTGCVGTVSTEQKAHRDASFSKHLLHSCSSGSRHRAEGVSKANSATTRRGEATTAADTVDLTEPSGEDDTCTPDGVEVDRDIVFETGKLALLADGAVTARQGGTVVMVTAVSNRRDMDESGFLPLSVEYREKAHASGKIPRTRDRREGQATDAEVLVARAIDRVLRPLFPPGYCFETQVVANVQALDKDGDPVVLAINAASAALCVSNIPWDGPAGCVRIGRVNGELVVNAPRESFDPAGWRDGGGLDLLYAGNDHRALMIELGGGPVPESQINKALAIAHEHVAPLLKSQRELMKQRGKPKLLPTVDATPSEEMLTEATSVGAQSAREIFLPQPTPDGDAEDGSSKGARGRAQGTVLRNIKIDLAKSFPDAVPAAVTGAAEAVVKRTLREVVVDEGRRPDGRGIDDTRDLTGEADVLPSVHGSGVFTRGETQSIATVALGPALDSGPRRYLGETRGSHDDELQGRLYLHYDFPPYSTNETGRIGGVNRRMVGHGNLAERAVLPVMPSTETFPYTTRVFAEVTMSNGSSSMAAVCAASLALMDAGVPVSEAVAGISVGLMTTDAPTTGDGIGRHAVLMDIQGTEDHYGDMDFKVAGTAQGVTAIQLDVKLRGGVPLPVLNEALKVARAGRVKVLGVMKKAIRRPNVDLKPSAPRCEIVRFEPDRKKDLVGFQGQMLKNIEENYGVHLDLSVEGRAVIFTHDSQKMGEAVRIVRELVQEITEGDILRGKVSTVYEYGCLVELLRNQQGLLHVSNMAEADPTPPAREIVQVGQEVDVRVVEVDRLRGLIKLHLEGDKFRLEGSKKSKGRRKRNSRGGG